MPAMNRLAIAIAAVAIWAGITVWFGILQAGRIVLTALPATA